MNTQAIEQLREALEMAKRELILWIDNYYDRECSVKRAVATSPAIKTIDAAIASLPTAQPTEVYVSVSVEVEQPEKHDRYPVLLSGGDLDLAWYHPDTNEWETYLDEEITHWLKPTKAILIPE